MHNTLKVSHFHIQPYPKQPITIQKPNQQSTKRKKISMLAILITSRSLLSVGANPKQLSAIQTPINCQKQEKKFFFFLKKGHYPIDEERIYDLWVGG